MSTVSATDEHEVDREDTVYVPGGTATADTTTESDADTVVTAGKTPAEERHEREQQRAENFRAMGEASFQARAERGPAPIDTKARKPQQPNAMAQRFMNDGIEPISHPSPMLAVENISGMEGYEAHRIHVGTAETAL